MPNDELYTITLEGQPERNERIPPRDGFVIKTASQAKEMFFVKHGRPPNLTRSAMLNAEPASGRKNKSFTETARGYADRTHEKTEHIPFMCYWPCYDFMSEAQMNWYFYLRSRLRAGEYPETDLSYIFIYIYEILNQVNVKTPNDGFIDMVNIWVNYRNAHKSLDRYLIDWAADYISFYGCDEKAAFGLLEKEKLFLLLPAGVLFEHYMNSQMAFPLELIARFSDYKFLDSNFIKGESGDSFLENLPPLIHRFRSDLTKTVIDISALPKPPFQRALFDNPDNIRLKGRPPFEKQLPFRGLLTSIIKEFENQLRARLKYRGRLQYEMTLPDEIKKMCGVYAQAAADGERFDKKVEIRIDRARLISLIQDSDEVREKLLDGNYEYGAEPEDITGRFAPHSEISPGVINENPEPALNGETAAETEIGLLPGLSEIQRRIIGCLSANGGGSASSLSAAFPGVFISAEIDRINDMALETINDLVIGFEDDYIFIMDEYISGLQVNNG